VKAMLNNIHLPQNTGVHLVWFVGIYYPLTNHNRWTPWAQKGWNFKILTIHPLLISRLWDVSENKPNPSKTPINQKSKKRVLFLFFSSQLSKGADMVTIQWTYICLTFIHWMVTISALFNKCEANISPLDGDHVSPF
jgi:hypothetical protein